LFPPKIISPSLLLEGSKYPLDKSKFNLKSKCLMEQMFRNIEIFHKLM
jgi:hypothetical protein